MKKLRNIIIIVVVVAVILLIFMSRMPRRTQEESQSREVQVPVRVEFPKERDIMKEVSFTSVLQGEDEAYVYPDVSGKFREYAVDEGETVKPDQVIAYLDRDVPGLEYQPYAVKAPIQGKVSRMALERGQSIGPQTPVARVADVSKLKAVFSVPDRYLDVLRKDKAVTVRLPDGREVGAHVTWFSGFLDPVSKTAKVHAQLGNGNGELVPGMFANARMAVDDRHGVLSVPYDAVLGDIGKFVFVVREGMAVRVDVNIGLSDARYTEVLSGLSPRDSLVVSGQSNLRQGLPVLVKTGD